MSLFRIAAVHKVRVRRRGSGPRSVDRGLLPLRVAPGMLRAVMAPRLLRLGLVLLLASGLVALVLYIRRAAERPLAPAAPTGKAVESASTPPPRAEPGASRFRSNHDCAECHERVAAECAEDQHPSAWHNGPLFPQDPKRIECASCHASKPIFEVGLSEDAQVRAERHDEGIGCIECHRAGDEVRGPRAGRQGPCNPIRDDAFEGIEVCAPCHAAHGSLEEWRGSSWAERGVTCQGCHMPEIEVTEPDGTRRTVRSHRMRTQRDPAFLKSALSVTATMDGDELLVAITNDGAGHNVPGEIFNRELFLKTTVLREDGAVVEGHRESMRTTRRTQRTSESSTQIRPGEVRTYRYAMPPEAHAARVKLGYKLFFLDPDRKAWTVWEQTLERAARRGG